jgi:myo-inositol-1(or 4)-monophosphatase
MIDHPPAALPQALLQIAQEAARAGVAALADAATLPREVTAKGFRDFVTNADFAAQNAILKVIREARADDLILTEESAEAREMHKFTQPIGVWWIIDPLDGTTNFQLGYPTYCVSIAVAQGDTLLAGVVHDPSRNLNYAAARGGGARLNGRSIHVSDRRELIDAIAACDWPRASGARKDAFALAARFGNACRTFRSFGSAAFGIACVANGWVDIYVHQHLQPWDCAAAALIVREAGGVVTRHDGSPWSILNSDMIATTPYLTDACIGLTAGL